MKAHGSCQRQLDPRNGGIRDRRAKRAGSGKERLAIQRMCSCSWWLNHQNTLLSGSRLLPCHYVSWTYPHIPATTQLIFGPAGGFHALAVALSSMSPPYLLANVWDSGPVPKVGGSETEVEAGAGLVYQSGWTSMFGHNKHPQTNKGLLLTPVVCPF